MGRQLQTTVYKDKTSAYPNGCVRPIPADVTVLGYDANVYTEIFPVDRCIGDITVPQTFLKVQDHSGNQYWIAETIDTWGAKINAIDCCAGGSIPNPLTLVGGQDVPSGAVVTSTKLYGLQGKILTITLGGIAIYTYQYSQNDIALTGTLDLTTVGGLSDGETIQISHK